MLVGALCVLITTATAEERRYGFDTALTDWQQPAGDHGVVPDPDDATNRVYRINADKPHHTQLVLRDSGRSPDFVASVRFRVVAFEGAPPAVYVYGRHQGTFRGVVTQQRNARTFCYFGQETPSVTIGTTELDRSLLDGGWVHAKLACVGERVAAKVWSEDRREPRWQMVGKCPGQETGRFAVGVWTSPREASTATVLFDDITFQSIGEADLAALGIRTEPRPPFDLAKAPVGSGVFELPDEIGIATDRTVLSFDRETAEVAHLVDRATGQEFVAAASPRALFELGLSKPYEGESLTLSSDEFAEARVRKAGDRSLKWRFAEHDLVPIRVRVNAAAGKDGTIRLRFALTNGSDWPVARIDFPKMAHPATLGEAGDDDRLILPWADGSVLHAPGSRTQSRGVVYPGHAFTQFTALYDGTAGMYLATYDADGHCKRWNLRTSKDTFVEMGLSHLRPQLAQTELELPYDVVVDTFQGDWRDAAATYKRWAVQQPWCAKKLSERDDIPQFLMEGAGIIIGSIQNPQGRERLVGANLEKLPELVAAYRERTGLAHVVFVPYGWENRGTWAGINYLPAIPSNEAWAAANAKLKQQGDRSAFMTSGFWWVVKRQKTGNGAAFDDSDQFERLKEMVIHKADGAPFLVDYYDRTKEHGSWRGLSASLCHGSEAARDTMRDTFLGIARLGVPLISFDQEIGGGQTAPCYSKSHGHPPGYGNWMWTDFRDLCQEILDKGKPIEPELGLFVENVSELAIPYLSTYWSRQFGEVEHGGGGARGVGLFSYLYHEYVTAIGAACVQGQGLHGTRPHPGLRRYILANNITRGLIPGPFLHDVPLEPTSQWHKELSPAYFSYCRPLAPFSEYLVLGESRRPPVVNCADVELWFYVRDANGEPLRPGGSKVSKRTVTLPAVTAGSFVAEDGSVATVLVNTTPEEQEARVALGTPCREVVLYQAERIEVRRWEETRDGQEVQITFEPFGVRVVVVRPL